MADPVKKSAKEAASDIPSEAEEEYELMPHKEIIELREELRKLKSLPPEAGEHMGSSFETLTRKMDRLIEIFEEAEKAIKVEEGAVSFKEKMAPIVDKVNKVLEQNSEIAEGIVALADIMGEIKEKLEVGVIYRAKEAEKVAARSSAEEAEGFGGMPQPRMAPPMPMQGFGMPQPMQRPAMPPMGAGIAPPLPRPGAPMPQPGMMPAPGPMPPPPGAMQRKKGIF